MPMALPTWANQDAVLYHGTTEDAAASIMTMGVQLSLSVRRTDFGRGFYTCTSPAQAERWARQKAWLPSEARRPAVVKFTMQRELLGELLALGFVRGDQSAEDYWAFVTHCRSGLPHHERKLATGFYDVVFGPVMRGSLRERTAHPDYDQISFHTERAVALLRHPYATLL